MRLIDADKLLKHTKFYNLKNGNRAIDEIDILHAQTVKAIPISEGATNGDMIKALFPNAEIKRGFYGIERAPLVCLDSHTSFKVIEISCVEDWWNAPYKKEVEE